MAETVEIQMPLECWTPHHISVPFFRECLMNLMNSEACRTGFWDDLSGVMEDDLDSLKVTKQSGRLERAVDFWVPFLQNGTGVTVNALPTSTSLPSGSNEAENVKKLCKIEHTIKM